MNDEKTRIAGLPFNPAIESILKEVLADSILWSESTLQKTTTTKPASHFLSIYQRRFSNPFINVKHILGFKEAIDSLAELPSDTPINLTLIIGLEKSVTLLESPNQVVVCMIHDK